MTASPALLLARLAARADVSGPDADLLVRFRRGRDEAAFAELVRRHGPAVYRVCRRLVGPAAADDAFQATFLVLATRADSVNTPGAVGSWLVGVAGRVARQMRAMRLRRHRHEAAFAADPLRPTCDNPASLDLAEEARLLDEELTRLPDRLRGPLVLCLMEGRTHDQAAADLGGSPRTVRRRLIEAKRLLRLRLERRGVVPAVAAALAAGAGGGAGAVPVGLGPRTVAAVFDFLAGGAATTAAPGVIAKGVVTAMIARKLAVVVTAAAVGLTALGVGVGGAGDSPGPAQLADAAKATDVVKPAPSAKATAGPVEHLTPNFAVTAPTREEAVEIGAAAERLRKDLAGAWLWKDLDPWKARCRIRYEFVLLNELPKNLTRCTYDDGPPPAVGTMSVSAFTHGKKWVIEYLPEAVLKCVIATELGREQPAWAGRPKWFQQIAALEPGAVNPLPHGLAANQVVRELLNRGEAVPLKALFRLTGRPDSTAPPEVLDNQGASVACFLVARRSRPDLVRFLRVGLDGDWDKASKEVYGFASVDDMQAAWVKWLEQIPPDRNPFRPPPYPSDNFLVYAPTEDLARRVANEAERLRKTTAVEWLGVEMPGWNPPCPLTVTTTPDGTGGGKTEFKYVVRQNAGRSTLVIGYQRMEVFGPLDRILSSTLPHEVMHTVLAHHIGRPVPRWADEGIAALAEPDAEQEKLAARCRELVAQGRNVRLRQLFAMTEYPADPTITFAQGHSVCRWLLNYIPYPALGPDAAMLGDPLAARRALLLFVRTGLDKNWDEAAKIYGYESVEKLEDTWLTSFQPPLPADGRHTTAPPPRAEPPAPSAANVTVEAHSPAVGRAVRAEALYQWATAGRRWFGADAKSAPSAGLTIKYVPNGSFHWTAGIKFADGRPAAFPFEVGGPLDAALDREIPFVVTYALLADHLGEGRPAWAAHGLGLLAQSARYQAEQDRECRDLLRLGKAVRLSALFAGGTELFSVTNNETQSQEHAVCRFLLTLRPEADLIRFVKHGMAGKDWNAAARAVYGVADIDALEAAWLRWVASPGSRLAAPPAPPPAPAPAGPPRIPPTAVEALGT